MTEKQYRLNKWGTRLLKNNRPLFDWTNEADYIVDLLNDLHEENQTLKNKYEKLQRSGASLGIENDGLISENYELQKENDELKKEITSLKVELDTHKHPLWSTREAERIVNELKQENEQLKSFKQRVFDLIDKTIEEETQIAENIEEVTQETRPYAKAVNRITIKTLENLKWELQE